MKLKYDTAKVLALCCLQMLLCASIHSQVTVPLAVADTDYTAFDYVHLLDNVSLNDELPAGPKTFRFITEATKGSITWVNDTEGSFDYLADPLSIQQYTGIDEWAYTGPFEDRFDNILYEVCVNNLCDTGLIKIFLRFLPDPPVAFNDTFYIETGSSRTFYVGVNDYDPDFVSDPNRGAYQFYSSTLPLYANAGSAPGNNFLNLNGTFTYNAEAGFTGTDSFTYTMWEPLGCDGYSNIATATIVVLPANESPNALPVPLGTINEESSLTSNLAAFAWDPENENLTFSLVGQSNHSIATITATGLLNYTASVNFIGYDTLYYQVSDLVGQTDTAQIVVQVINANNDAPEAPNQSITGAEDAPITQSVAFIDLIDGDALTYSLQSQGLHGIASISSSGILNYTPEADYTGYDTVYYRSCDSENLCDVATISIQLLPTNDAPQAQNDFNTVPRNTALNGTVASNDSDIDSPTSSLVYSLQNSTMHGTVTLQPNGAYTYQPETVFYGEDTFTYSVCDNNGACASADVQITVTYANLAPATNDLSIVSNEDESLVINLQSVSADVDGGDLVYDIINLPSESSFQPMVNVGGNFTPAANWNGALTLQFKVCDTGNLCDTAQINITVLPVNDAPQVTSDTFAAQEDGEVIWIPQFIDIDNDNLQLHVLTSPNHSELVGDLWVPESNFAGIDSFLFEVCDEGGLCTQSVAYLEVSAVNDAPQSFPLTLNSPEDEWLQTTLTATDSDSQGYSFYLIEADAIGEMTLQENGTLQWLPQPNYNGTIDAEYRVCDSEGACDTSSITLNITPVNDLPQSNFPLIELEEDANINWTYSNYLTDVDGDVTFLSMVASIGVQTLIDPISNSIGFTAVNNNFGDASCVVNICDTQGGCITDTIPISIQPINDAPVAENSTLVTFQEISITDSWYTYVSDVDDSVLYFEAVPTYGILTTNESGVFEYMPSIGFIGADSIAYTVCDSSGICDFGLLIMDVFPPNQPPNVLDGVYETCQGISISVDLTELITDDVLMASALNYSWSSDVPAELTFNSETALLTIATSAQYAGTLHIEMNACDNGTPALCDSGILSVVIGASVSGQINAAEVQQVSCNGMNDGSIAITGIDIPEGATFEWDNGLVGSLITNLAPGTYTVTVMPQAECPVPTTTEFTITEPASLSLTLEVNSIAGGTGGSIHSIVEGGTPPYLYSWNGPNGYLSTNASAEALSAAGTYELTITDANGCLVSQTAMVTNLFEMAELVEGLIYPNPANGEFITIDLRNSIFPEGTVRILDATGRTMASFQNIQQTSRIAINEWAAGVYFIEISGNEKSIVRQFIRTP